MKNEKDIFPTEEELKTWEEQDKRYYEMMAEIHRRLLKRTAEALEIVKRLKKKITN